MNEVNDVPINQIGLYTNGSVSGISNASPASVYDNKTATKEHSAVATTPSSRSTHINHDENESDDVYSFIDCACMIDKSDDPVDDDVGSPSAFQSNISLSPENIASVRMSDENFEAMVDEGYDSDGMLPDFIDISADIEALDGEQALGTFPIKINGENGRVTMQQQPQQQSNNIFEDIPIETMKQMSTKEMKMELKRRGIVGLSNKNKASLLQLLLEVSQQNDSILNNNNNNQPKIKSNGRQTRNELSGFPSTAFWELLTPNPVPVKEPDNITNFRAPTIPESDANVIPAKYNYNEVFDRPPFVGKKKCHNSIYEDILKLEPIERLCMVKRLQRRVDQK